MVAQIAVTTMKLQAAVDDLEAGIGRQPFGSGGKPGRLCLPSIDGNGCAAEKKPCCLEFRYIIRDPERKRLEIGEPRTELFAFAHIGDGAVEAELSAPERARCDIEPPPIE